MALIKREKTEVLKQVTVRMGSRTLSRLGPVCDYLESSKDHVISEAVRYIIDRDKEFTRRPKSPQILPQNAPQILPQNPPQILQRSGAGK